MPSSLFRTYKLALLAILIAAQTVLSACSATSTKANAQEAKPVAAAATETVQQTMPPSTHRVRAGENTLSLARTYLPQSQLMTVAELDSAIRDANHLGKSIALKPGTELNIPTLEKQPVVEHARPLPKDAEVRAVYLTGTMAGSVAGMNIVKHWKQVGGNAVVFDIKDSDGSVNVPFEHPLAPHRRPAISNLPKFVRWLHSMDMHAIARIALFRDENIAQHHSELAVHSHAHPDVPWRENGKLVWTDTSNPQVQDYNIALAKMVAQSGADEIQFDYVRFPAEGDQKDAVFYFQTHGSQNSVETVPERRLTTSDGASVWVHGEHSVDIEPQATSPSIATQRKDVIANFLDRAYGQLHPLGVLVSLDVFGVMAWQRQVDLAHTGQDIVLMAKHCDVLSPMIYPSHFFGMDGYALPGDAPEHFISMSMARFQRITAGSGVTLRPWLQAFAWRTKTYSPEYIKVQVLASKDNGGDGFLFWNARNDYAKPFAAMPEMMAASDQYLGKKPAMQNASLPKTAAPDTASTPAAATAPKSRQ